MPGACSDGIKAFVPMRTPLRLILGTLLAVLSVALPCVYLIGWWLWNAEQWSAFFGSPRNTVAALCLGSCMLLFWLWMLASHLRHRKQDGPRWTLVLILAVQIGAAAYFLCVYRRRVRTDS